MPWLWGAGTTARVGPGCREVNLLEDPDWATLRRALNKVVVGPGKQKDRAVLFWFSGHGHTLKEAGGKKLGYIVPVDAPNPDRDELGFMEHAISMREIETIAKRIQARHAIMLFDSCFSGAIFQAVRSKPSPYIEEKVKKSVRQFVTAGTEDEQVPDQSVFKEVFLQAIEDGYADRNKDGYVTGMELGDYMQEQVVNYSRKAQHPQFGKINDPQLDKGDFVFALKGPSSEERGSTDLEEEKARLERERQELERMKTEIEREKLKAERERLEAEKRKLETRKRPAGPGTKDTPTKKSGDCWLFPDSDNKYLSDKDLSPLSSTDLWRARNEIFARRGYIFKTKRGKEYGEDLGGCYKGTEGDASRLYEGFNRYEKGNVERIKKYEKR